MGLPQHNPCVKRGATRHLPARVCLRKDCGLIFQPRRWNQRYCGDPDCRQSVLRWQAAKRQRAHRRSAENRKRHAEAEARRRRLAKSQSADTPVTPQQVASPDQAPRPVIARAPGGTPKPPRPGRAWSRSKEIPEKFCDRPGCYGPLPSDCRAPARYCGGDCCQVMRRVRDRERKWCQRQHFFSGSLDHGDTSRTVSNCSSHRSTESRATKRDEVVRSEKRPEVVRDYPCDADPMLSSSSSSIPSTRSCMPDDHSKTASHCRSRPPPAD